jgi:hypothetical protein
MLTLDRSCAISREQARAIWECNFSLFTAIMVPHAELDLVLILDEFMEWIFRFDDMFDNGDLRRDYEAAKIVIDYLNSKCEKDEYLILSTGVHVKAAIEIARLHEPILKAIKAHSTPGKLPTPLHIRLPHIIQPRPLRLANKSWEIGIERRYVKHMRDYCQGALAQVRQVRQVDTGRSLGFAKVLEQRRHSVCVGTLFALVELGHQIDLPDYVFEYDEVRRAELLGIEITLLHNDLLSYCKEEAERVPHNTVIACRLEGMGAQDAVSFVAKEAARRMGDLETAVSQLTNKGCSYQSELLRYLQGIIDVIKANLYWSLESGRFFSDAQKLQLQTCRTLDVSQRIEMGAVAALG